MDQESTGLKSSGAGTTLPGFKSRLISYDLGQDIYPLCTSVTSLFLFFKNGFQVYTAVSLFL